MAEHTNPRPRPLILALGMPRTGTHSLKLALEHLGLGPVYHGSDAILNPAHCEKWYNLQEAKHLNPAAKISYDDFEDLFQDYNVVSDMPVVGFAPDLINQYWESKVILTSRDVDSWYKSVDNTLYRYTVDWRSGVLSIIAALTMSPLRWSRAVSINFFNDRFHGSFPQYGRLGFHEHYEEICRLVPEDRLLKYRVEDGWQPLCNFLGVPVPSEPFPRGNGTNVVNKKSEGIVQSEIRRLLKMMMIPSLVIGLFWYLLVSGRLKTVYENALILESIFKTRAQNLWAAWFTYMNNDAMALGIGSLIVHESVYFGRASLWYIAEKSGAIQKYKLQQDRYLSPSEEWDCLKYILFTHLTVELPQIWFFHPFAHFFRIDTSPKFPSLSMIAIQVAVFFVLEDTWHYFMHRLLHCGPLFKYIHYIHHRYSAPIGLATAYASPIEIIFLGIGTIGAPLVWTALIGRVHMLTIWIFIVCRICQAVDAHSGYHMPWGLSRWLPGWAGSLWHDRHHASHNGNYGSTFLWWDLIMGTVIAERPKRARRIRV